MIQHIFLDEVSPGWKGTAVLVTFQRLELDIKVRWFFKGDDLGVSLLGDGARAVVVSYLGCGGVQGDLVVWVRAAGASMEGYHGRLVCVVFLSREAMLKHSLFGQVHIAGVNLRHMGKL